MIVKHSSKLTLHDRLSRLTLPQAQKLLGSLGAALFPKGGAVEIDIAAQVLNTGSVFQVTFPHVDAGIEPVVVTVTLHDSYRDRLQIACSHGDDEEGLLFKAATLSLILEEKTALGFAAEPTEGMPWELMNEAQLESRALTEREQRACEEKMTVRSTDGSTPWTDYTVMSALTGKTYRVALRGMARGQSFCTCPDFRKNRLGTCKHVIKTMAWVKKKFSSNDLAKPWTPKSFGVYVRYDGEARLGMEIPGKMPPAAAALAAAWKDRFATDEAGCVALFQTVQQLERLGENVVVYPDAEERLNLALHQHRMDELVSGIRKNPAAHPLRTGLLKAELLPYQIDGVAFAAGAGRAVLADEMGLGKTIQGIGIAELLAQQCGVQRVLIVCPASLKSQWRLEIQRFCGRSVQLITGKMSERTEQYATGAFFTVCNYEQVLRDYLDIERSTWDLIILDEAQRIKNWEAKTSRIIKSLRSPYALVLTGTPLENRLDDLYSVLEFIDARRLGPAYRFIHQHRVTDEKGKVLGYKNLDSLRKLIAPVLLRRTRQSVALDLPPRTSELVRITPTDEQLALHGAHMLVVASIVRKAFITEMDLLRLQKALLMARMSADSTFLVDKEAPGYSSKLERLIELLETLIAEPARKILLFSEWTTMLNLIEPVLQRLHAGFVRLDGSVPQKKRQQLVAEFQTDAACRVFLTTNAGATGLNLQAADTVINVDLPWNPALLEQRIARAHRMGQKRPVHVYILITEGTIEENLLATLAAKHELAAAVLDPDSDLSEVSLVSGIDALKRRLELLLGAKPAAAPDITVKEQAEAETKALAGQQARVSQAGGQLITAAFSFLAEALPATTNAPDPAATAAIKSGLEQCIQVGPDGQVQLNLTLPGKEALDTLAAALARLMAAGRPGSA